MLIVLIGYKKNSGKDTAVNFIKERYKDFYITSFAKQIRKLIMRLLNIKTLEELEKYKRENDKTYRHYATTIGKFLNVDMENSLIKYSINEIKNRDFVIISDFRLKKEYDSISNNYKDKAKIITINIKRDIDDNDNSYTNTDLDDFVFDYTIENNSSLDVLKENILNLLKEIRD